MLYKYCALVFSVFLIGFSRDISAEQGNCGISVESTVTQEVVGRNIGFYVSFYNESGKTCDAIKYKVRYYDGFEKLMGSKSFQWQAGNLFKPVESGNKIRDGHTNWVKGANKIKVTIQKVHFIDGQSCIN